MRRHVLGYRLHATLAVAALGLSLSATAATPPDGHNARNALDWAGTYIGTLPSGSGSGYQTLLVLRDKQRYDLYQQIEHKGETYREATRNQRFRWDKSGSVIQLSARNDRQRYFVSEGYVELQGSQGRQTGKLAEDYRLQQMHRHAGQKEELLIDPRKLQPRQPAGQQVSFDGIWNMQHATQLGHRSLAARFVLNCKQQSYRMNDVRYYSRSHLQGKLLDSMRGQGHDIPVTPEDKVMTVVMQTYCAAR